MKCTLHFATKIPEIFKIVIVFGYSAIICSPLLAKQTGVHRNFLSWGYPTTFSVKYLFNEQMNKLENATTLPTCYKWICSLLELVFILFFLSTNQNQFLLVSGVICFCLHTSRVFPLRSKFCPCCDWLERFPYLVYKSKLVLSCTFTFLHLISPGTKLQYALLLVEREILHIYRTSAGERYRTIPTALSLES